jgi:hypothetical protein
MQVIAWSLIFLFRIFYLHTFMALLKMSSKPKIGRTPGTNNNRRYVRALLRIIGNFGEEL